MADDDDDMTVFDAADASGGADADGDAQTTIILPEHALTPVEPSLPKTLLVLPLERTVLFPGMALPLVFSPDGHGHALIEHLESQGQNLFAAFPRRALAPEREDRTDPYDIDADDLHSIGCLGRVVQGGPLPDGDVGVLVSGIRRLRLRRHRRQRPLHIADVEYPEEIIHDLRQMDALGESARRAFTELVEVHPSLPDQMLMAVRQIEGAGQFADFCAATLPMDFERRLGFLSIFEIEARLQALIAFLEREIDIAKLSVQAREEIRKRVEDTQREMYLREQLKAIRTELGEDVDEKTQEVERFERLIDERQLPDEAADRAREEVKRLAAMPPEAAEYHVIRSYLSWLVELPWSDRNPENLDLPRARKILEADHYGLEDVKSRFVEFLAVRKLNASSPGTLLCLAGPPGVGKTSMGKSIAAATGREFHRVSLGGMKDEAEIKGHRRTYVGAMPGKILQGLRRVGKRNPVFMLDELDKLGSDWRGDPSSALLEVLDPAQNHAFLDHYLDVPFDLRDVMFIATANALENIPDPLRDRMEIIEIPGYIPGEKREIAKRYLLPRQIRQNGLKKKHLNIRMGAIDEIIEGYTREAGVRELERQLGRIARKVATKVAEAPTEADAASVSVAAADVADFLGPLRFRSELDALITRPGIAVGLAWTPTGGDVLFIEAAKMPGGGKLRLTGRLGEVMAESAQVAVSVIRSRAAELGIDEAVFRECDIHLHVPAGAVPKDGPSAGITIATALISLLRGQTIRKNLAMTGELTLRGVVGPIGGLRNKLVGAKRARVRTVVIPQENRADFDEVPERVRSGLKAIFVRELDEVLEAAGVLGK